MNGTDLIFSLLSNIVQQADESSKASAGDAIFNALGLIMYLVLFLIALWGAFCVVVVWMRVASKRFRNETDQTEFLDELDSTLARSDFKAAIALCDGDQRAMPQLILLAIENRKIGYSNVRQLVVDRFQNDVLADLEHRLSWVNTVIKSAPMIGLLGTVIGMMGAFGKLAGAESVKAELLAGNIMVALITTACGLSIAIPLVLCVASINIRINKMESLVAYGLDRFFATFRKSIGEKPTKN